MAVSKKVIIFFLLELFVHETAQYEILDVMFLPPRIEADVVFTGDDGISQEDKLHDLMQLSFSAYGEDLDFLLHRTVYADLHKTEVEIHGSDGSNDSEIRDISSIYYLFENYTTSVHGYKNRYGQFEGFVMLRNGRTSYFVEPASEHFPNVLAVASKSIVYKKEDISFWNLNQHIRSEYRNLINNYAKKISKAAYAEYMEKSPFTFVFNIDLMALPSLFKFKGSDTSAYLYLLCNGADVVFRQIDFDSIKMKLIPRQVIICQSTSDPKCPFKNEPPSSHNRTALMEIFRQFQNYTVTSDAVFSFTHRYYFQYGLAIENGMCDPKKGYGLIALSDRGDKVRTFNYTLRTFLRQIATTLGASTANEKGPECEPPINVGSYIMSNKVKPKVYLGRFSRCSIDAMTATLKKFIKEERCTRPDPHNTCGNGILEPPEEDCDCGEPHTCDIIDKCCTPKGGLGTDRECKYRLQKNRFCSAQDDACCTEDCKIKKAGTECDFGPDGCIMQECDGTYQRCTKFKKIAPNKKQCYGREGFCSYGYCNKSFCENKGMPHCNCTGDSACRVCCEKPGNPPECVPARDLGAFNGDDVFLPHGTECGENRTCDISGVCTFEGEIKGDHKKNSLTYVLSIIAVLVVLSLVAFTMYWRRRNVIGSKGSSAAPIARKAKIKSPFNVRKYHPEINKKSRR